MSVKKPIEIRKNPQGWHKKKNNNKYLNPILSRCEFFGTLRVTLQIRIDEKIRKRDKFAFLENDSDLGTYNVFNRMHAYLLL